MNQPKLFAALALAGLALAPLTLTRTVWASECLPAIDAAARNGVVPHSVLSAIAQIESGRYDRILRRVTPWPWAVQAEGKSLYFNGKAEAVAGVKVLQERGVQNIDVGCMQINLLAHPRAFPSLDEALDPHANVAYAARFLTLLLQQHGTWEAAAGNYHSATPDLNAAYRARFNTAYARLPAATAAPAFPVTLPVAFASPAYVSAPLLRPRLISGPNYLSSRHVIQLTGPHVGQNAPPAAGRGAPPPEPPARCGEAFRDDDIARRLCEGLAAETAGDLGKARDHYLAIITLQPDHAVAGGRLAHLAATGAAPRTDGRKLNATRQQAPSASPAFLETTGRAMAARGNVSAARTYLSAAAKLGPKKAAADAADAKETTRAEGETAPPP